MNLVSKKDNYLTGIALGELNRGNDYIYNDILPRLTTPKQKFKIPTIGDGHYEVVNSNSVCCTPYLNVHCEDVEFVEGKIGKRALKKETCDDEKREHDGELPMPWEDYLTTQLVHKMRVSLEAEVSNLLFSNTDVPETILPIPYTDYGVTNGNCNTDPSLDALNICDNISLSCGNEANVAVMNYRVWKILRRHPAMIKQYCCEIRGSTVPAGLKYLQDNEIAAALGVERILVSRARYLPTKGAQKEYIIPNDIMYYYAPDSANMIDNSFGYKLTLEGENNFDGELSVRKKLDPSKDDDDCVKILLDGYIDWLITNFECAHIVRGAIQ